MLAIIGKNPIKPLSLKIMPVVSIIRQIIIVISLLLMFFAAKIFLNIAIRFVIAPEKEPLIKHANPSKIALNTWIINILFFVLLAELTMKQAFPIKLRMLAITNEFMRTTFVYLFIFG